MNFVSDFLLAAWVNPLSGADSAGCPCRGTLSTLWDVEAESWKHPERSQERGRQPVLPGSQMPQSACRAQTLQECTNKARLKPLYSQYRLEKRAKVIRIMQPVLHEWDLLPTSQITHHLNASNQGVEWFTGSYSSSEVPRISRSSCETGTYYLSMETTSKSVCAVRCKQNYSSLYWKPKRFQQGWLLHTRDQHVQRTGQRFKLVQQMQCLQLSTQHPSQEHRGISNDWKKLIINKPERNVNFKPCSSSKDRWHLLVRFPPHLKLQNFTQLLIHYPANLYSNFFFSWKL